MKKFLLFVFTISVHYIGYCQHKNHSHGKEVAPNTAVSLVEDAVKQPETLVLEEEVFDFGKIPQGKPVTHIFNVSNSGKTALKINNVQASCGCTTPEWEKDKDIPAGGSSKITVGYNAAAEGPFTKFITITYNENLSKQITIKGEVWKTPAASAPEKEAIKELKD